MADYYEIFAADYDWLFDDDALASGLAIRHPATARLLERTPPGSAVLDAACVIPQAPLKLMPPPGPSPGNMRCGPAHRSARAHSKWKPQF